MAKGRADPTGAGTDHRGPGDAGSSDGDGLVDLTADDSNPGAGQAQPSGRSPTLTSNFRIVRRGYDRDSVDNTIERASARIQALERTVAELEERVVEARKRPMLHQLDEAELLVVASEETAELVRAARASAAAVRETATNEVATLRETAQAEYEAALAAANKLREDARAEAAILVTDAEQRAKTVLQGAEMRAQAIVDDANRQANTIVEGAEERYDEIRATIMVHRKRLREQLDSQRDELHQIVDSLTALRREFSTSFKQITETLEQTHSLSGRLWRVGEPVQRAEGFVERVFEQLGDASLPPRDAARPDTQADDEPTAPNASE